MKIEQHDTDNKVIIIAEIGNNHEGDIELAKKMIHEAAACGVDVVKFQTFQTEHYVSHKDEARFARLKQFELTADQFAELAKEAKEANVTFISTPFDIGSAHILDPLVAAYKISSGDCTFYPLLEAVAKKGKPMIVSTGLSTLEEVSEIQRVVHGAWNENGIDQSLALLHCVSSYPVPLEQANLNAITTMKEAFPNCVIGYSDHTLGSEAAVASVALGARIVEKHFTLDKKYSDFRDHQLSANPKEMKQLVESIRAVEQMLGTGEKVPQECELDVIEKVRRSIVSVGELPEGHVLTHEDVTWIRPAGGTAPGNESELIGKSLKMPIGMQDWITAETVE
jgi:N,N'-diacetyllegionaminate synthase